MSDSVVIKKVERETIVLEDCFVGKFSPIIALAVFSVLTIFTYSLGVLMISVFGDFNEQIYKLPYLALGMAGFFTFFLGGLGACSEAIPAYEIKILGQHNNDSRRMIIKTTPEADQVAVCRATQELESKARSISRKERELEQIAMKCK